MSIARHHNEWLSLIEQSGPFLSVPVLMESDVFATGLDPHDPDLFRHIRVAYDEWRDRPHDLYGAWIEFVLREVLDFDNTVLRSGQSLPNNAEVRIREHAETIRADHALVNPESAPHKGGIRLLALVVPVGQDLEKPLRDKTWKSSPNTRMVELLHGTDVRLGLVTNGEDWTLVHAPRGETSGFATWKADLWCEESITLRAFRSLLTFKRFFGVAEQNTLEKLYERSAQNQQEVTDQLGLQVRHAVEILVSRLDRLDQDNERNLLRHLDEKRVYEAALTVMMRLVFLMCAEERGLFPLDEPIYAQHYAVTTLREALREMADKQGEEILERRHDAWVRLLALFRLIHGGSNDDRLRIVAYGGGLFDPDRFSFLEGRLPGTSWRDTPARPLPIDNRTVLHLLEALQILQVKMPGGGPAEARRLSFRALDIEQIGHVYEGLLDHTAIRALPGRPVLGLLGTKNKEPEVELATLERITGFRPAPGSPPPPEALLEFLRDETGRSISALRKDLLQRWPTQEEPTSQEPRDHAAKRKNTPQGLEALASGAFLAACHGDPALYRRIVPYAGLIRTDTFGNPVVIPGGAIYVTQGADRRSTGTHYTPRSLTEPIVQYTLEPLVYLGPAEGLPKEEWKLRSPRELLDLKICDMAMGSGAFLVQACRYMSERLVEAWERNAGLQSVNDKHGQDGRATIPYADPVTGKITERPIPTDPDERLALARRLVAERCLYGVDINPLAVEIAKLSLWLITLDKGRPFTFVDHAFKAGDSLLGLHDPKQLENFHLDPKRGESLNYDFVNRLAGNVVRRAMEKAADLRRRLEGFVVNSPRDAARKHQLLREADEATAILRTLADLVVGAQLRVFRKEYDGNYDELIQLWMQEDVYFALDEGFDAATRAQHRANLERHARTAMANRKTFHWALEFPEVVGGFSSIIGNPPFMGGLRISELEGIEYNTLLSFANPPSSKKSDLSAYFFRHAGRILTWSGTIGFITTNTISQGATRKGGLEPLLASGFAIYSAVSSFSWPGIAAVVASRLHLFKGTWDGAVELDFVTCGFISSFLTAEAGEDSKAEALVENVGRCFQGSNMFSMAFYISPKKAHAFLEHKENKEVIKRGIGGKELNERFDASVPRWTIDFGERSEEEARCYPDVFSYLEATLKPERLRQDPNKYPRLVNTWWKYWHARQELYATIENKKLDRVFARCRVCNTHMVDALPPTVVYTDALIVFSFDEWNKFAIIQSTIHEDWALKYASSLKKDTRYIQKDCFDTFPFPPSLDGLDAIGERYHEHRRQVMLARQEGLTKTYNRFHNPKETSDDIQTLRDLHVEMDRAVLDAYRQSPGEAPIWDGFGPDDLEHGFHETKQGLRFTVSERARRELLDRLLELNHKRYAEEVAAGLHDKKKRSTGFQPVGKKRKSTQAPIPLPKPDEDLFGGGLEPVTPARLTPTPPKDRPQALMALLLHLVKHRPGLAEDQYADALGDAVRIQKHIGVLTDDQQEQLQEALPQIPALVFKTKPKVKFKDLWNSLQQLGYLRIRLEGATRHFEPRDQELHQDHGWLVWPVEDFAALVFAVGDSVDRERDEAKGDLVGRDLKEVEV